MVGATIALGPGKARLLQLVDEMGSLNQAAARMKMSYMRAWILVGEMNRCFASPLVLTQRGGRAGGGASLSPLGRKVLGLYLELERQSGERIYCRQRLTLPERRFDVVLKQDRWDR